MARAIYFRWHSISNQACRVIAPPVIARLPRGDPELNDYCDNLKDYETIIGCEILERARDITCSIVLANIHTDDFKERCRSNFGHLRLAMLFYNLVTDDELYYIYGPLWLAVDFSFVQCSDKLPDSPTHEDKLRWHLRKFTKLRFAYFAAYYFEQCLQQRSPNRHDSKQPSKAERQAFASGLRSDTEKEEEEPSGPRGDDNNTPEVVIHEDPFATPKAEDREVVLFNSEEAKDRWTRGAMNVVRY
ncbi:hypothetical protein OCU04_008364 [Sclerotinia nivalis]|uniref:Uncharacterized protein n=1 Tax=Sclerotinia nivalis TaxID=352851 RepID=A0A9X0DGY5_9HELO|nr:hypothetical protein OCU04_008364 [Sclerotinia nivalis]